MKLKGNIICIFLLFIVRNQSCKYVLHRLDGPISKIQTTKTGYQPTLLRYTKSFSGDFLINLDLFLDAHEGPLDLQTPQKLISARLVAPN